MRDKSRDEFEASYAKRSGCSIYELKACRWGEKGYRDPFAAAAWFGWVDSRNALVVDLPKQVGLDKPFTGMPMDEMKADNSYNIALAHCRAAIEVSGLRVKQ